MILLQIRGIKIDKTWIYGYINNTCSIQAAAVCCLKQNKMEENGHETDNCERIVQEY